MNWQTQKAERQRRLESAARFARGKIVESTDAQSLLEAVIVSGDRVCLEGDN
ncbi:MAG: malonate decarboxylase subunit alpha, partial [Verrucomicrobia bacterium]|nr:malonate decarboxylase subunit alpha [Verrucomicrobiota bacterium]